MVLKIGGQSGPKIGGQSGPKIGGQSGPEKGEKWLKMWTP